MQRKSNSKVNILRRQNEELAHKANYHAQVSAQVITWVHQNCTDEQKQEFASYVREIANNLAS